MVCAAQEEGAHDRSRSDAATDRGFPPSVFGVVLAIGQDPSDPNRATRRCWWAEGYLPTGLPREGAAGGRGPNLYGRRVTIGDTYDTPAGASGGGSTLRHEDAAR